MSKRDTYNLQDALAHTQRYLPIMLTLLPEYPANERKLAPHLQWRMIGRDAYSRGQHGMFKLAIAGGSSNNSIVGLYGTYVTAAGKLDAIEFRFGDLLEPDLARCTNPNGKDVRLHIWEQQGRDAWWEWYIVQPKSLKPLHVAIMEWQMLWNGAPWGGK